VLTALSALTALSKHRAQLCTRFWRQNNDATTAHCAPSDAAASGVNEVRALPHSRRLPFHTPPPPARTRYHRSQGTGATSPITVSTPIRNINNNNATSLCMLHIKHTRTYNTYLDQTILSCTIRIRAYTDHTSFFNKKKTKQNQSVNQNHLLGAA